MALTITARGTGTNNTSNSSFNASPTSNFTGTIGRTLGALFVSADNSAAAGSSNNLGAQFTDSLGNVWDKQTSAVFDNGAASAGVQGSWYTSLLTALPQTSTTVPVTTGTAAVAKTYHFYQVEGSVGVPAFKSGANSTGATSAAPTVTTTSIPNAQAVLAGVAMEAGTTQTSTQDADTTNGNWSAQQYAEIGSTTSGNASTTQTKVVTATATQTFNPTMGLSVDLICSYIIVGENIVITTAAPTALVLTTTGLAPTVVVSTNVTAVPATAALATTPFEPTVITTANQVLVPATAALVTTPFAPIVLAPRLAVPGVAALALTGFAPTVTNFTQAPQDFTMNFDPNDAGNTVVSGRYSVLKDLSANSYDLEQATTADQPEQVNDGGVNVASFTFDPGVDEFMAQEAGADWLDVVSSTEFTLAARVRMTFNPTLTDSEPVSGIHGIIATSFGIFVLGTRLSGGSPQFVAGMYNDSYTGFSIGSAAISLNTWYDVVARFSGTELSITVNGTKTPITVSGTLPYFAWEAAPVNMGRNPSGGAYFEGDVRFARIYNYALSDGEVSNLSAEWNGGAAPPVVVVPATAALVDTQFAPNVLITDNQVAVPGVASLADTQFAPTVLTPRLAIPTTASAVLTPLAPTVLAPRVVIPGVASLSDTQFAPSAVVNNIVRPGVASLSVAQFAPTILAPRLAVPATAALALTGFAPTIVVPASVTAIPSTASAVLTSFAPTVLAPRVVVPATASLADTQFAPTVLTPRLAVPGVASLADTQFAPSVVVNNIVRPDVAALVDTQFAPTILTPRVVVPATASLTLTRFAPTANTGSAITVIPSTRALVLTAFAPTVIAPQVVVPGVAALVDAQFAPTVLTPRVVVPSTRDAVTAAFAPSVIAPRTQVAGTIALTLTTNAPSVLVTSKAAGAATTTATPVVIRHGSGAAAGASVATASGIAIRSVSVASAGVAVTTAAANAVRSGSGQANGVSTTQAAGVAIFTMQARADGLASTSAVVWNDNPSVVGNQPRVVVPFQWVDWVHSIF